MALPANNKRRSAPQRRAAILAEAARLFSEKGYAATSIDAIIAHIGGSKRDIYAEFGSKKELFTTLIEEASANILYDLAVEEKKSDDLESALQVFGVGLLTIYLSPSLMGLLRTLIAESAHFPDLIAAFYEKGPARSTQRVNDLLTQARIRGEIDVEDCGQAADYFIGMLRGNLQFQVLLGLSEPPGTEEIEKIVADVVCFFLKSCRKNA